MGDISRTLLHVAEGGGLLSACLPQLHDACWLTFGRGNGAGTFWNDNRKDISDVTSLIHLFCNDVIKGQNLCPVPPAHFITSGFVTTFCEHVLQSLLPSVDIKLPYRYKQTIKPTDCAGDFLFNCHFISEDLGFTSYLPPPDSMHVVGT